MLIIPGATATFAWRHQERVPAGTVDETPQTPVLVGDGLTFCVEGSASCKPVTLWPSHNHCPRWAGRMGHARRRTHSGGPREGCQECYAADDAAPHVTTTQESLGTMPDSRYVRGAIGLPITRRRPDRGRLGGSESCTIGNISVYASVIAELTTWGGDWVAFFDGRPQLQPKASSDGPFGEFVLACSLLQNCLALEDPLHRAASATVTAEDPHVITLSWLAVTLATLVYIDQGSCSNFGGLLENRAS